MISTLSRLRALGPLVFIAFVAVACGQSQPSNFYTISSLERAPNAGTAGPAVGVGPISLPEDINRPQIVTRSSPNKVELAEFDKWAESLDKIFPRAMADNLGVLLETDRVVVLPRRRNLPLDFQVEINVTRFDTTIEGQTQLTARWILFGQDNREPLVSRESVIATLTETPDDFESIVASMSRAVENLSREIARTIKAQPPAPAS